MILTLLTFGFLLLGLLLLLINDRSKSHIEGIEEFGVGITVVAGFTLIILIICIILNPTCIKASIKEFESVQLTLDSARENPLVSKLELVKIQEEVIVQNKWLVRCQYWTKHKLTNWFWTKDILTLTPIQ